MLLSIFYPTSKNGIIIEKYSIYLYFILIGLLIILLVFNGINKNNLKYVILLNLSLLVFTLLNTFNLNSILEYISYGSYIPYLAFSCLICLNINEVKLFNPSIILIVLQIIYISCGILVVLNVEFIKNLLINNYSMGYSTLVSNMMFFNKPVFVYGSHSIASFFYACFSYINIIYFRKSKNMTFIVLTLLNIILSLLTKSNTGYFFSILFVIYAISVLYKKFKMILFVMLPGFVFLSVYYCYKFIDLFFSSLLSKNNGILSRYGSNSVLSNNLEYIMSHIVPIGIYVSQYLYFTDSGYIVNWLKGSIFLIIGIYVGLYQLLKYNIKSKNIYLPFYCIVMLFEFAYPVTLYLRFLVILPVMITLLNNSNSIPKYKSYLTAS